MADIQSKLNEIYSIEQLAEQNSVIHRMDPMAKILVTVCYLICLLSMEPYNLMGLVPFLLYPIFMMEMSETPYFMIFKRAAVALPFVAFAGISNLIFDAQPYYLGEIAVRGGMVTFVTLLVRTMLSVTAVLLLVATTPFRDLTGSLRRIHVPDIFVMLIEMIYRYLGVLGGEATTMITAYRMRSGGRKWPKVSEFGSFVGQLLLRSIARAQRVYDAMCCRLYDNAAVLPRKKQGFTYREIVLIILAGGSSVLFRMVDVVSVVGNLFL